MGWGSGFLFSAHNTRSNGCTFSHDHQLQMDSCCAEMQVTKLRRVNDRPRLLLQFAAMRKLLCSLPTTEDRSTVLQRVNASDSVIAPTKEAKYCSADDKITTSTAVLFNWGPGDPRWMDSEIQPPQPVMPLRGIKLHLLSHAEWLCVSGKCTALKGIMARKLQHTRRQDVEDIGALAIKKWRYLN